LNRQRGDIISLFGSLLGLRGLAVILIPQAYERP
jgi:hypothetical protein